MTERPVDDDWDVEDEGDGDDTVPCPYCRRPVHEDAPRCPHCERYISAEDAPAGPRPLWLVLGVLACLGVVAVWVLSG